MKFNIKNIIIIINFNVKTRFILLFNNKISLLNENSYLMLLNQIIFASLDVILFLDSHFFFLLKLCICEKPIHLIYYYISIMYSNVKHITPHPHFYLLFGPLKIIYLFSHPAKKK